MDFALLFAHNMGFAENPTVMKEMELIVEAVEVNIMLMFYNNVHAVLNSASFLNL